MDKIKQYQDLIDAFDTQSLDNIASRRMAHKPLYDYFQRLLRDAGVKKCGLDDNAIKNTHLPVRWVHVRSCLECVDNPKKWDELINSIQKIRSKIEHNDYYDPKESSLNKIREKIPEFTEWIIHVSEDYFKKSNNFTLKESFCYNLNLNINKAEMILEEYCNDSSEEHPIDFNDYCSDLCKLMRVSKERLKEISNIEDIQRSDLENLIQMGKIISRFDTQEDVLIELGMCPKCGGKIKTTQNYLSGSAVDSEPYGAYYSVGCKDCSFLIHDEVIHF